MMTYGLLGEEIRKVGLKQRRWVSYNTEYCCSRMLGGVCVGFTLIETPSVREE